MTPPGAEKSGLLPAWPAAALEQPTDALSTSAGVEPDVQCILSLAGALLGYGLPAHRVEEAVIRLAHAFGRRCTVFGLPTALTITLHGPQGSANYTVRAEPGTTDLARLDALHQLVAEVERGDLDAFAAEHLVHRILQAPRHVPRWLDLFSVALVAFGGTLMLGGHVADASCAGVLGLAMGGLLALGQRNPTLNRVTPVLGPTLVTVASSAAGHLGVLDHPLAVSVAALFVLLPGLTLTLAMTELATGHLVSGTARSMGAMTVFLQLGLGMLLGARLGRLDQTMFAPLPAAALAPATLGALLLASGFAVLFAIRRRDLGHTLLVSFLSFFICRGASAWLGVESGVLIAACSVGLYSHAFARRFNRPSSTLTLPGVTMLVPGSLGLISVSAAALHDASRAFDMAFQMLMIIIALSTGILLAAAALPPRSAL